MTDGPRSLPRSSMGGPPGEPGYPPKPPEPWPSVLVHGDLRRARREWLHTNGAGAYASSTLAGMHTRRYHGLLVAALDPPGGRHVFLSHVDATIASPRTSVAPASVATFSRATASKVYWELAKHQFPGVDPEAGRFYLDRFDQDPLPRWTYAVAGGLFEVTLALVRGQNAAVLRYAWRGPQPISLVLRPLLAARDFHHLLREHGGMLQRVELRAGEMRVQPRRELPRICFRYEGTFVGSPDWWRRFEYLAERDRGLDFQEDLWTPGVFELRLDDRPAHLLAAVDHLPDGDPAALLDAARAALLAEDPGPSAPPLVRRLAIAAEAYRADLAPRPGVLAGYPWFEVWGRETLMALPGLYLVPAKIDAAAQVLRATLAEMRDGLVPNRGADARATDATLWLFEAARLFAEAAGDGHPFVAGELFPALREAFEAIVAGAPDGIRATADGLLAAGLPGDAPTWMDARLRGIPVVPRAGCPVELTALWARGCETLARLARSAGDEALARRAEEACRRARAGFQARFWCSETGYPYDVISEESEGPWAFRDPAIRPNAVIALAVDPACFTPEQAEALLDRARQELVTPAGVRTLSPGDRRYVGRYRGGVEQRDAAYHQGAAWPWLLGFFVRAARRSAPEGEHILPLLERLVASAAGNEMVVGQVPELSDGDAPHRPGGAFAAALGVAELLRAAAWDLAPERGDGQGG